MSASIAIAAALALLALGAGSAKAASDGATPPKAKPPKAKPPKAKAGSAPPREWDVKILPAEITKSESRPATTDDPTVAAARALAGFMLRTGKVRDPQIAKYQRQMGGGIAADGIVGPATRARAAKLGVILPADKRKVINLPPVPIQATPPTARRPAPPAPPEPKARPAARPSQPAKPVPTTAKLTAVQAAREYQAYMIGGGSKGSKAKPNPQLKIYQAAMGGLDVDGIDGPKTQARARALLTVDNVKNGSPAPVMTQKKVDALSPRDYALALQNHLDNGGSAGTAAKPSPQVRSAQLGMGGGIVADGIYGPNTQARARALGVVLKPRVQYKAA